MRNFRQLSDITEIEVIARGLGVRIRNYLNHEYADGRQIRWRKLKGIALIEWPDGRVEWAELHWFEGQGIGRVEITYKKTASRR